MLEQFTFGNFLPENIFGLPEISIKISGKAGSEIFPSHVGRPRCSPAIFPTVLFNVSLPCFDDVSLAHTHNDSYKEHFKRDTRNAI